MGVAGSKVKVQTLKIVALVVMQSARTACQDVVVLMVVAPATALNACRSGMVAKPKRASNLAVVLAVPKELQAEETSAAFAASIA